MIRNPNGYGSVVKLSGKRRKPYAVRKTVGYDDRAYPIYQWIGFYEKRADAVMALAQYNSDPYDIDLAKSTFSQLYERWSKEEFPKLKLAMKNAYKTSYNHAKPLHDKLYSSLRKSDFQAIIDDSDGGYSTRSNIKMLFAALDRYAFDNDIIKKQYSANCDVGKKEASSLHTVFTDSEVKTLWQHQGEPYVDETLFMLYTGCRVLEMLQMKCCNIDLDQQTMIGGVKTAAGINRTIPIHPELLPIIKRHLSDSEYLFPVERLKREDAEMRARQAFSNAWKKKMNALGLNHTTHDCRHTVRSKLDSAGANAVCIDRIMGHASSTIGEKIYTHKTVDELKEAIKLLSYGVPHSSALVTR